MMKLNANEIELRGNWLFSESSMIANKVSKRIEMLIKDYLIEIASDDSGWGKLFLDPDDKRYWELTYQNGELHGGGTPLLKNINKAEARKKYKLTLTKI